MPPFPQNTQHDQSGYRRNLTKYVNMYGPNHNNAHDDLFLIRLAQNCHYLVWPTISFFVYYKKMAHSVNSGQGRPML